MRLLLDTHIWIWSVAAPERLGRKVRDALTAAGSELWLSPISVWEAMLLAERGKLSLHSSPSDWVAEMLRITPAREAALTHDVAMRSCTVRLAHRDPADRFLAATAIVHDLILVTADKRLLRSRDFATMPN